MTVVKGHSKVRNVNNVSNGVSQLKLDICEMDLMMNYNELIRQNGSDNEPQVHDVRCDTCRRPRSIHSAVRTHFAVKGRGAATQDKMVVL